MENENEQSTCWSEDRMLAAIADVEDRSRRAEKMLSDRIGRLERKHRGGSGELEDFYQVGGDLARALLVGYGVFLLMRALMYYMQSRQQQQQG